MHNSAVALEASPFSLPVMVDTDWQRTGCQQSQTAAKYMHLSVNHDDMAVGPLCHRIGRYI